MMGWVVDSHLLLQIIFDYEIIHSALPPHYTRHTTPDIHSFIRMQSRKKANQAKKTQRSSTHHSAKPHWQKCPGDRKQTHPSHTHMATPDSASPIIFIPFFFSFLAHLSAKSLGSRSEKTQHTFSSENAYGSRGAASTDTRDRLK